MTDLVPYCFEDHAVRAIMFADAPWFVANDVATVLGYRDAANMTRMLDDDEKGTHIVSTPSADQKMTIISESGLYAAILKSRREEARRFRKWVTAEVLPSLRRTGRYTLAGAERPDEASDFDPPRLTASVAVVREARRLWGPRAARGVWVQLGLPAAIADASGDIDGDPLAGPLQAWLDGRTETTIGEAVAGIGFTGEIDHSTRTRIGRLLRLFGWRSHKVRRGRETVNAFIAPVSAARGTMPVEA